MILKAGRVWTVEMWSTNYRSPYENLKRFRRDEQLGVQAQFQTEVAMKRFRNSVLLCLGTSVVVALGTWFLLTGTRAEAQTGVKALQAKVTAVVSVPGGRELTRWEDPEYGIVCYLNPAGFFACVKK
jgi:hypothetical protein